MLNQCLYHFKHYSLEIIPALAIGFLLSGIIKELVPTSWVEKNLGTKGIKPILYSTIVGTIVPVCCWGSLPLAVTFYKKGASLGPIFAFLITTPATSVNAIIVVWRFFGIKFATYIFFVVIFMGIISGIVGNLFKFKKNIEIGCKNIETCPHCIDEKEENIIYHRRTIAKKIKSILKFAYIDMPKEIGLETLLGLILAALVSSIVPLGIWIKKYLYGMYGYLFSVIVGLIMYMCATMSVPFVYALVEQGLNIGAGLTLLLIGPITSYGTILVIRKEFGIKVLLVYLILICLLSLISGYLYSLM